MVEVSDVTLIIVSYNSAKTLQDSIESCIATVKDSYPNRGKVVVYDNASIDTSPQIIDEYGVQYPDLFIGVKGKQNLGFGRANNEAVKLAPSKMYVLVNPDVTFQPETVAKLAVTLGSSNDIAIVCPKLLFGDGSVQPSVRRFPTFTYFLLRYLFGARFQRAVYWFDYHYEMARPIQNPMEVDWAIGAFLLISGKYVERHGLFDEQFFLYFEDVSLCADVWRNRYRVVFQPNVCATHLYKRASTSSKFNYLRIVHFISALKYFAKVNSHRKRWKIVALLFTLNGKTGLSRRLATSGASEG